MPGTCTYTFISTNMYYKTLPINWLLRGYYYYRFAHKHAYILKYGMGSTFAIIKFPIWLQWPKWSLAIGCCKPSVLKAYCIARNFRPEKIFAFFTQAQWKFCHAEILHTQVFTHGCQAVLVVPHDHQSAVLPGIQNLFFLIRCLRDIVLW